MASYEELRKDYVKLAKRADQRMVRLEALSYEKGFRHVKQWAYGRAATDIERYEGRKIRRDERPRWNRAIPEDEKKLKEKLADVKRFLEAETSTRVGIQKTYKDRVRTINNKYDTQFDWQTFADFAESKLFDELMDYGSGTTFDVIATLQKDKKKLEDKYNDLQERHRTITAKDLDYDVVINNAISKELQKNGLSLFDLI